MRLLTRLLPEEREALLKYRVGAERKQEETAEGKTIYITEDRREYPPTLNEKVLLPG